jgi:hypothetical protein
LWFVLAYHAIFLTLHAYDDWKHWIHHLLVQPYPQLRIFFEFWPSKDAFDATRVSHNYSRHHRKDGGRLKWTVTCDEYPQGATLFEIPLALVNSVRRRFYMFAIADLGLPAALYVAAFLATCYAWR